MARVGAPLRQPPAEMRVAAIERDTRQPCFWPLDIRPLPAQSQQSILCQLLGHPLITHAQGEQPHEPTELPLTDARQIPIVTHVEAPHTHPRTR